MMHKFNFKDRTLQSFFLVRDSKGIPLSQTPSGRVSGIVEKYKGFFESYGTREVTDPLT